MISNDWSIIKRRNLEEEKRKNQMRIEEERKRQEVLIDDDRDGSTQTKLFFAVTYEAFTQGSFTLAAAVCGFRSGLPQRRDRNFSISAEQSNRLPQMHAENAVISGVKWSFIYRKNNLSAKTSLCH